MMNITRYARRRLCLAALGMALNLPGAFASPELDWGMVPYATRIDKYESIGTAFGEGIVIRNGLIIGTTPEDEAGRWNLLKSSAAVNPGNSGDRKKRTPVLAQNQL
ncbi:hypothetical protein AGMMS49942_12480 [Spirochaetia bacterium]|nr:hypothetical protein AGMMS49942_12480 [Spirochaetia bacterium]